MTDLVKLNNAIEIRERIKNLDPDNNPSHRRVYEDARREFIGLNEEGLEHRDGSHAMNDDQIFSWTEPPSTGHPGHEPGCRCRAEPVLA